MIFNQKKLTIATLLSIDNGRITRSKSLVINKPDIYTVLKDENILKKLLSFFTDKYKSVFKVIRYSVLSDSGSKYTVIIETNPEFEEKKLIFNEVRVFCGCHDFMYRSAYILNKSDNLFLNKATQAHLKVALSIKPTLISPSTACKHIYACMEDFSFNYKKYLLS